MGLKNYIFVKTYVCTLIFYDYECPPQKAPSNFRVPVNPYQN